MKVVGLKPMKRFWFSPIAEANKNRLLKEVTVTRRRRVEATKVEANDEAKKLQGAVPSTSSMICFLHHRAAHRGNTGPRAAKCALQLARNVASTTARAAAVIDR